MRVGGGGGAGDGCSDNGGEGPGPIGSSIPDGNVLESTEPDMEHDATRSPIWRLPLLLLLLDVRLDGRCVCNGEGTSEVQQSGQMALERS